MALFARFSSEVLFEEGNTLTEAVFEVSVAGVIDAFEGDDAVITICPQRVGHRLELVGQLAFAHSADLQRRARRIDLHVLDVDVAQIAVLDLVIPVREGAFVAPAIVGPTGQCVA